MIRRLELRFRARDGVEFPFFAMVSDNPEEDLDELLPFHLEVFLERVEGGGVRVGVERRGRPPALGYSTPLEPAAWDRLVRIATGDGRYLLGLHDEARPAWPVQLFDCADGEVLRAEVEAVRSGRAPPPRGDRQDPQSALRRAELDHRAGRTDDARAGLYLALERDANFLPALLQLARWEQGSPLGRMALQRALRLAPEEEAVRRAAEAFRGEAGEGALARLRREASEVDPASPFRAQWEGCRGSAAGRFEPLTRADTYRLFLRAAFEDGRMEGWEEQLVLQLAGALGLTAQERRSAYEQAAEEHARGEPRGGAPLDREELFARLAGAAFADGVIEDEEVRLLETAREVLGLPPGEALEILMGRGGGGEEAWQAVEGYLDSPEDVRVLARLRAAFFLGSSALRPGLAETYATALDKLRVRRPAALSPVLPPLVEVGRYSRRLLEAYGRALRRAAATTTAGRAAAWAALRANRREQLLVREVARGLGEAADEGSRAAEVLAHLEEMAALWPRSRTVREEYDRAAARVTGRGPGPAARTPDGTGEEHRAAELLAELRGAAAGGDKLVVLDRLEALEELPGTSPDLLRNVGEARLEAVLAASYHGWRDLLDACLASETQLGDSARLGSSPWDALRLRLAALDLAVREGRDRDRGRLAEDAQELLRSGRLTPAQRSFCERRLAAARPPGQRSGKRPEA